MDIFKFRKILKRFSNGDANETERALVEAWYRSYTLEEVPVAEVDLDQLRGSMLLNIQKSIGKKKRLYLQISGIAASLMLFAGAMFFVLNVDSVDLVYHTGTKETKEVRLSDGSVVWLNANSRLKAPKNFNGDSRQVALEKGEVFFNVKKDRKHPFIVSTGALKVKVLGTSFDIKAYAESKTISISVATGKVAVILKDVILNTLTSGQRLIYNVNNGEYQLKEIDAGHVMSWKEGTTYLEQADFNELALVIKNLYGLNIKAGSETVANYRFNLRVIHNLPQQEVLTLIEQLHDNHFRKEGNGLILY